MDLWSPVPKASARPAGAGLGSPATTTSLSSPSLPIRRKIPLSLDTHYAETLTKFYRVPFQTPNISFGSFPQCTTSTTGTTPVRTRRTSSPARLGLNKGSCRWFSKRFRGCFRLPGGLQPHRPQPSWEASSPPVGHHLSSSPGERAATPRRIAGDLQKGN